MAVSGPSRATHQVLSHAAQVADVRVEQHLEDTASVAEGADGTYRRLWPTSLVFARYLGEHPQLVHGKRVLELGAGSGAIGLCCAALGAAHVCITDVPGAIGPITSNVQCNPSAAQSGIISIAACDWGKHSHIDALLAAGGRFDVVVACEVVYKQDCATLAALLHTMDALLSQGPGATILLAYKCRTSVPLEDCAFFGPAAERFLVDQVSLRPYEGGKDDAAAGGEAAADDGRLMLYKYKRACAVHEHESRALSNLSLFFSCTGLGVCIYRVARRQHHTDACPIALERHVMQQAQALHTLICTFPGA